MTKLLACVLFFCVAFTVSNTVLASSFGSESTSGGQISEALLKTTPIRFLPPNPLYYLVRLKELVQRFFTSSAKDRAEFDFIISSKRLKETYLLLARGDLNRSQSSLKSYVNSLVTTKNQLEKADGQNQEVRPIVDDMLDGLSYQEIILNSLSGKIDGNLESKAVDSFSEFVVYLEKYKPGISSRYKLSKEGQENQIPQPSPVSSPVLKNEATPTASPVRIIY